MRRNIRSKPSKLNSGMTFVVGILFIIIGLTVVIPTTIASGFLPAILFGLVWTGFAVVITVANVRFLMGKGGGFWGGFEVSDEGPDRPTPAFRPDSPDHQHITPSGPDAKARLEQLETLKNAGLIDEREYQEKRKEILREL